MNRHFRFRGGSSALCYPRDFAPFSLCSIEGEGEQGGGGAASQGGGGGAAGLLDDEAGDKGGAGGDDKGGAGGDDKGGAGGDDKGGKTPPAWATSLSADAGEGETASNRDFIAAKGFQDPDAMVKSYRELERALHGGKGYVKVPGEGAKPEEIAAFRATLGVPEKADGYEIKLPDLSNGDEKLELDTAFLDPMREAALKAGIPKAAFGVLGEAFVQFQLDQRAAELKAGDEEAAATIKGWGASADAKKADFRKGAQLLGIDKAALYAIQNATMPDGKRFGADRAMEMLSKLGAMAGEDLFAGSGGKVNFGVASGAEAQGQIDAMGKDPATAKQMLVKGTPENVRYERLLSAVAHFKEAEARKPR